MTKRTFIELLIDEPRLEVSLTGGDEKSEIRWRCSACGVGADTAAEELFEVGFAHAPGCPKFGGQRRGAAAQAAEVLEGLAFVCSGDVAPQDEDSLSWVPEATARLLRYPDLFTRPPFVAGPPADLAIMRDAMLSVVDDLTWEKR